MTIRFRHALSTFLMLWSGAAIDSALLSQQTEASSPLPNIVFIFSDDHACQAISAYGESRQLLNTPNIDRIAKEGMRFDRCLVTNSICGPSRAALLTGKYSHVNGFYNNTNCTFDGNQTTFTKLLQKAGYQTAIIGKWHLGSNPTGFDEWRILPGQGVYYDPSMIHNGKIAQERGYVTDLITDYSIDWLKSRDKTRPFLLMCQHKAPHREWSPPIRHLGHDHDRVYPEPNTLFDNYSGRSIAEADQDMTIAKTMTAYDLKLNFSLKSSLESDRNAWNAYYSPRNQAFRDRNPQGQDLVRWKYQRYMHDYLGCVKAVDDGVGKLLQTLDDEGLAANTIVVYSSDQGFYLGEHGWFDKRWIFEESLRAPLLVRWPGVVKAGSTTSKIVSNVDLAETLIEAAGLDVPGDMQGSSLLPILRGNDPQDWRSSFFYEYFEYPDPHHVRPHQGIVNDRYKLLKFNAPDLKDWELFDLKNDPSELLDVSKQPEYAKRLKTLQQEFDRLKAELKVPDQYPSRAFGNALLK